jgi:hypothetical protein
MIKLSLHICWWLVFLYTDKQFYSTWFLKGSQCLRQSNRFPSFWNMHHHYPIKNGKEPVHVWGPCDNTTLHLTGSKGRLSWSRFQSLARTNLLWAARHWHTRHISLSGSRHLHQHAVVIKLIWLKINIYLSKTLLHYTAFWSDYRLAKNQTQNLR